MSFLESRIATYAIDTGCHQTCVIVHCHPDTGTLQNTFMVKGHRVPPINEYVE